ncbi:hypothetical protein HAX54_029030 [Datura stramonium]|uniref:Uncharacterized protein n=1 Tax=Datura stramonium TaxID=4076 RepID=A0ABS8V6G1_DATST|nr:hypothetical protein [Datura stramonium]
MASGAWPKSEPMTDGIVSRAGTLFHSIPHSHEEGGAELCLTSRSVEFGKGPVGRPDNGGELVAVLGIDCEEGLGQPPQTWLGTGAILLKIPWQAKPRYCPYEKDRLAGEAPLGPPEHVGSPSP